MHEFDTCSKRQEEDYKGTLRSRCLEKKSKVFLEIVTPDVCEGCPVHSITERRQKQLDKESKDHRFNILQGVDGVPDFPMCPFRTGSTLETITCELTGHHVDSIICNKCDADTREHVAGPIDKVQNYFGAVRKWVANGRPTRTDAEVEYIFKTWCEPCEKYDKVKKICNMCGCAANTGEDPLLNKIKMKTEVCPMNLWD